MWICKAVIVEILLFIQFYGTCCSDPTFCAYKYPDYHLNASLTLDPTSERLLQIIQTSDYHRRHRKLSKDNNYEQCDDTQGAGYCFTLWAQGTGTTEPVVIGQGCWIQPVNVDGSPSTRCQASTCTRSRPPSDPNFDFCCCKGTHCNHGVDGSKPVTKVAFNASPETFKVAKKTNTMDDKPDQEYTRCAFRSPKMDSGGAGLGKVLADGRTAMCARNTFCFSYYTMDPRNSSQINIEYQGCWDNHDERNVCDSSVCTPYEEAHRKKGQYSHKQGNNSHFCCCLGDMCNNNISRSLIPIVHKSTTPSGGPELRHLHDSSYKDRTIIISLSLVTVVAIVVLAIFLVYKFCCHQTHIPIDVPSSVDAPTSPTFNIDDLKISCLLNKGRFSEVWKGSLEDQDVAVKIYLFNYRQYYHNEKYVYSLPCMEHENVLKFYGGEERISHDGSVEHLLVLQYIPDGTLVNYLKNNTMDWYTMCKMCQSLARGMAHLHTDIDTGDLFKPTIAHRDLNSRNILVKPDLSLVIADLGFCMAAMGSKLIHKGHTENAEQTSLTDVGTLRYMAPELLDGAVNLRDCEASLKQIDMYAYGLAMWEISSRCVDLYQGCPMPEFALPYQAEAGSHPTFEEMQLLVSRNKIRPKFPEVWKDYHQAIRALKETIEECWDHDAEARLTAMCVEERVVEMRVLWSHDNRNKGVTPTINTALLSHITSSNRSGYHGNGQTQWGGLGSMSESSAPNVVAEGSTSALIINDIRREVGSSNLSRGDSVSTIPPSWMSDRSGSFSTSTMDTTVAATPNEPAPPSHPKSHNINAMKNQPVPPHQGRNAIVERNTHKRSDEELAVVGNNLLYGKDNARGSDANDSVRSPVTDSDLDHLTDNLETSLMQNDALNQHRSPPILYLQNHVRVNSTGGTSELPPKVVNNPSARQDRLDNVSVPHVANVTTSHVTTGHTVNGAKTKKAKEMGIFGHLALLGRLAFSAKFEGKKCLNDGNSMSKVEGGTMYDSIGQHNPLFEPSQILETEIRLTNGGPVVRPAHLRTKQSNVSTNALQDASHSNLNRGGQRPSEQSSSNEVRDVVTDIEHGNDSPMFSRLRGAPYSKSTSDLSPQRASMNCLSKSDEEAKCSRPSTLSLKGHNYSESERHGAGGSLNSLSLSKGRHGDSVQQETVGGRMGLNGYRVHSKPVNTTVQEEEEGIEKIKLRIKTPVSEKRGRLSLYDDRLMTERDADSVKGAKLHKTSMSLQQCKSIDETCVNVYNDCTC